jgi:hypothetical protein
MSVTARRGLVATVVAIVGIVTALGVGFAAGAGSAPAPIPRGAKTVEVVKEWPRGNRLSRTISDPVAVESVVTALEGLAPPPRPLRTSAKCGRLTTEPTTFEVRLLTSSGAELAKLRIVDHCVRSTRLWVRGEEQPSLNESGCLKLMIQALLRPGSSRGPALRGAILRCPGGRARHMKPGRLTPLQRPRWLCSSAASKCGTLHVLVWVEGGLKRYEGRRRLEPGFPVQITKRAPNGGVRTFHTTSHTLELKPGAYRVAAATRSSTRVEVTVSAGQEQEVTLTAIVH